MEDKNLEIEKSVSKEIDDKLESIFGGKSFLESIEALRSLGSTGDDYSLINLGIREGFQNTDKNVLIEVDKRLGDAIRVIDFVRNSIISTIQDKETILGLWNTLLTRHNNSYPPEVTFASIMKILT